MKSKVLIFVFVATLFVVALYTHSLFKNISPQMTPQAAIHNFSQNAPKAQTANVEKAQAKTPLSEHIQNLMRHADSIGRTVTNTAQAQRELDALGAGLKPEDLPELKSYALDEQHAADSRWFAVELLSASPLPQAIPELQKVALSDYNHDQDERFLQFETAMRARSVEGILKNPDHESSKAALLAIQNKTSDSFVLDRTQRALLSNNYLDLIEKDKRALEKLTK